MGTLKRGASTMRTQEKHFQDCLQVSSSVYLKMVAKLIPIICKQKTVGHINLATSHP
jgi:hypothetical protein